MTKLARGLGAVVLAGAMAAGCYGADDAAEIEGNPYSATLVSNLTVGGFRCPTRGEIAVRTIPADNLYYITTFGGGSDNQPMACSGYADGRWLYIADSWRFGCGARVRVTNPRTGRWCVTRVADVGPNICVEQAARKPIIDASPAITRELFGTSGVGWSDRVVVRAEVVPSSTPLSCGGSAPAPAPAPTPGGGRTCYSSTWGRDMTVGSCVQSRSDQVFYQCTVRGWIASSTITSSRRGEAGVCTTYVPLHS